MYKNIKLIIVLGIIGLLLLTGCTPKEEVTLSAPLKLGLMPSDSAVPFVVAKHKGFFEEEGLDVELTLFRSAKDRNSAIQTNNIHGATYDLLTATLVNSNSPTIKFTSITEGNFKLVGNVDSLSDLKGKKIGISKNTLIEYYTDKILSNNKINSSEVIKEAIPQIPVRLEMLQNGKIEGATLPDPLATFAISKGAKLLSSSEDMGMNIAGVIFTQDYIDTHPEEIKKLYNAYNKAVDYMEKEPLDKYINVLIQDLGFPEGVKDTLKLAKFTKAHAPSEEVVDDVVNWLLEKGLITKLLKYDHIVDDSFVK